MDINKLIKECFNTEWNFTDFFYAYCENKGIDDPENDLTDEEYSKLEEEAEEWIRGGDLRGLRDAIIEDINARIKYFMEEY